MEPREARLSGIYWWLLDDGFRILVRVEAIYKDLFALRVLAATPAEVIRLGFGAGERVHRTINETRLEKAA